MSLLSAVLTLFLMCLLLFVCLLLFARCSLLVVGCTGGGYGKLLSTNGKNLALVRTHSADVEAQAKKYHVAAAR